MKRLAWLALLLHVAAFFYYTVTPFAPTPPFARSRVEALEGGGWRFLAPSLFRTDPEPAFFEGEAFREGRFTVELAARIDDLPTIDPARFVTYSRVDRPASWNWGVTHQGDGLRLRFRGRTPFRRGVLPVEKRFHLVVVYSGTHAKAYVDGAHACDLGWNETPFPWAPQCPLVIANELTGDRPLFGELYALRIYDASLDAGTVLRLCRSQMAGEDFEPATNPSLLELRNAPGGGLELFGKGTETLPLRRVDWPYAHKWSQLFERRDFDSRTRDVAVNVAVGLPFGFLLAFLLRRRVWLAVVGGQLVLSVAIESLQFFSMIGRYADWVDIVTNTLGAVLGVVSCRLAAWVRSARAAR